MIKKLLIFSLLALNACAVFKPKPQSRTEFRGFWVATVVNIDWPNNGNDTVEKQKADYVQILDFYQDLNFNAAIVQVRCAGDAFYNSEFAPFSRFLNGREGEPDSSKESILAWMIMETHKRGMEFHAWLNPYRATFDLKTELLSPKHDFNQHPEWMLKYGTKYYYDPGLPKVQEQVVNVIDELVSNYDIDAVHFDDYFYPYTIKGEVFKDSITHYNCAKPDQSLDDWRRSNIDSLIKKSYDIIKLRKPWVQFGVSPFGVWKNNTTDPRGSDTRAGQTTYEDLYADPLLWMEKGWLDYLIPQVYWSMELPVASHRKIVDWWSNQNQNTNLYIGNGPYKIRNNSDEAWNKRKELPSQISYAREKTSVQGNAFFSAKSLMNSNRDVVRYLKKRYYKNVALPPSSIKGDFDLKSISLQNQQRTTEDFQLQFSNLEGIRFAMIYPVLKNSNEKYPLKKLRAKLLIKGQKKISIPIEMVKKRKKIAISFIDFYGRESEPIIVHLNKTTGV